MEEWFRPLAAEPITVFTDLIACIQQLTSEITPIHDRKDGYQCVECAQREQYSASVCFFVSFCLMLNVCVAFATPSSSARKIFDSCNNGCTQVMGPGQTGIHLMWICWRSQGRCLILPLLSRPVQMVPLVMMGGFHRICWFSLCRH